jgi:hypothetical protein
LSLILIFTPNVTLSNAANALADQLQTIQEGVLFTNLSAWWKMKNLA